MHIFNHLCIAVVCFCSSTDQSPAMRSRRLCRNYGLYHRLRHAKESLHAEESLWYWHCTRCGRHSQGKAFCCKACYDDKRDHSSYCDKHQQKMVADMSSGKIMVWKHHESGGCQLCMEMIIAHTEGGITAQAAQAPSHVHMSNLEEWHLEEALRMSRRESIQAAITCHAQKFRVRLQQRYHEDVQKPVLLGLQELMCKKILPIHVIAPQLFQ